MPKPQSSFSITDEQFAALVKNSTSVRQVLSIGVSPVGGSYRVFHRRCSRMKLDISHFKGSGWSQGKNLGPKRPLKEYLVLNSPAVITTHKLRLRLLAEGIKQPRCESCLLTLWKDLPIPLELDHVDGNPSNNDIANLRVLCPNCHAQTPTYRGLNIRHK